MCKRSIDAKVVEWKKKERKKPGECQWGGKTYKSLLPGLVLDKDDVSCRQKQSTLNLMRRSDAKEDIKQERERDRERERERDER